MVSLSRLLDSGDPSYLSLYRAMPPTVDSLPSNSWSYGMVNLSSFHLPILTVRPNIVLTLSSKTLPLCCNVADLLSLQNQENAAMYRDQLLYYAIYHQINTIEKLPAGLEALKPRR